MLADLRTYFNDLGAVGTFHGKVLLVDLLDRFIDLLLYNFIGEFEVGHRLDRP